MPYSRESRCNSDTAGGMRGPREPARPRRRAKFPPRSRAFSLRRKRRPPESGRARYSQGVAANRVTLKNGSADEIDALLLPRLVCARGLCGQLQYRRILTFTQQGQQHDTPVGKFEGVVMGSHLVLVDLSENGRPVVDCLCLPAEQAGGQACYVVLKGELRSRADADRQSGIIRRRNPRVPVPKSRVTSLSPTFAGRDRTL
jgi:hypothetical protein